MKKKKNWKDYTTNNVGSGYVSYHVCMVGRGMLKILLGIYMNEWMEVPLLIFVFLLLYTFRLLSVHFFVILHTLDSNNKYISYLFIACCAFQNVFIVHRRFSINFIDKYFVFSKFLLDKRILISK